MKWLLRTAIAVVSSGIFISGAQASTILTGATAFLADQNGKFTPDTDRWNTLGGDALSNFWMSTGTPGGSPDGLSSPFINGPGDVNAAISIVLAPGVYQFTVFGNDGTPIAYHGMNLFFNGDDLNPRVSAFAQDRTGLLTIPPFFPDASPQTLGLQPTTFQGVVVPGTGTLNYNDGENIVTLIDFFWTAPSVFGADRVYGFGTVPDGQREFIGSFALRVEAIPLPGTIPEPSSLFLLSSGLLGLAGFRRRTLF